MRKEISYYKTSDGKQFAKIRFMGEKNGKDKTSKTAFT